MIKRYHKSTIYSLLIMLIIFACVFMLSFFALRGERSILDLGLGYIAENYMVMVFSIVAALRVFTIILTIDHKKRL